MIEVCLSALPCLSLFVLSPLLYAHLAHDRSPAHTCLTV